MEWLWVYMMGERERERGDSCTEGWGRDGYSTHHPSPAPPLLTEVRWRTLARCWWLWAERQETSMRTTLKSRFWQSHANSTEYVCAIYISPHLHVLVLYRTSLGYVRVCVCVCVYVCVHVHVHVWSLHACSVDPILQLESQKFLASNSASDYMKKVGIMKVSHRWYGPPHICSKDFCIWVNI